MSYSPAPLLLERGSSALPLTGGTCVKASGGLGVEYRPRSLHGPGEPGSGSCSGLVPLRLDRVRVESGRPGMRTGAGKLHAVDFMKNINQEDVRKPLQILQTSGEFRVDFDSSRRAGLSVGLDRHIGEITERAVNQSNRVKNNIHSAPFISGTI